MSVQPKVLEFDESRIRDRHGGGSYSGDRFGACHRGYIESLASKPRHPSGKAFRARRSQGNRVTTVQLIGGTSECDEH
jgi:hypothetical protein